MIERRLQPYFDELCRWSFQRFAQQCAQRGVRPIVIYRPAPADFSGQESAARSKMLGMARSAGLEVIDLSPAFDSVTDRSFTGSRQMGRSHYGTWSPTARGRIVQRPGATAVWFIEQTAGIAFTKAVTEEPLARDTT